MDRWSCDRDPEERLARFVAEAELECRDMGGLATYPGSRHWHLKRPGERGVLELTWDPVQEQAWLKVARNRQADWINESAKALVAALTSPNG